jgi:predicted dehydrogenase
MGFVRFGIVGCGDAAYFHVLAFKGNPDARVRFVAAHDINAKTLARFCKMNRLTPYTRLEDMLRSDIDAVLLAVPHHLHAPLTKSIAAAGKHVLCEKPMAPTLEECDAMIQSTQKAGVKFMIAENHRFLPAHVLIKDLVQRGLIGDVFFGRAYEGAFVPIATFLDPDNWQFTFDRGGGGVIADQGVHKFAILNWLLGTVRSAQCWLGKAVNSPPNKGEDCGIVLLRFKCGAMITVDVSSATVHPLTNRLELHGTKGTILEDHAWEQPVQVFSSHDEAVKKGEFYCPPVEHGVYPQYYTLAARCEDSHFADCILDDEAPEFTPQQARDAVAVVLLSYLSAKMGRAVTMEELETVRRKEGTKSILEKLGDAIQHNFDTIKWS